MEKRLLLISSSKVYGGGYLDHAQAEISNLLGPTHTLLFVPFALMDYEGYSATARGFFERIGYKLESIHTSADPVQAVREAEAIFIGGGNTFRLLKRLYDLKLIDPIRTRVVEGGLPYIGSSAGSNVAGPTIRTTNDMPIVEPPSLNALGLVSFQINPHYIDPDPATTNMGETREERLKQYLEENEVPVAAIREGAMLRITGEDVILIGRVGARIFRRNQDPVEVAPGNRIGHLLEPLVH